MAIVIMIASLTSGFCSDITITINHATGPADGSITITLDDNSNGPYSYVLTGPVSTTFTNSDLVNMINDLPKGMYCLTVTNADGCSAEICFEIKKCKRFKGKTFCHEVVALPAHVGAVMLIGYNDDEDDGILKDNTFDIRTNVTSTILDDILPSILETTNQETDNILLTGTSPYLVSEQNVIEDDDILFLFSFDQTGTLEWVYYSGENANYEGMDDASNTRYVYGETNEVKINPNPVLNDLMIELNSDLLYHKLEIYSASGQLMLEKKIGKDSELNINVEEFSPGMYFIQFTGLENREVKKFIKN